MNLIWVGTRIFPFAQTRNLLVTQPGPDWVHFLPTINEMLDQNCRVTLVLHDDLTDKSDPFAGRVAAGRRVHLAAH